MAWSASYVASATMRDALKNAIALNIGGSSPDTLKLALYDNTVTPSPDTDPQTFNVAPWNSGGVTGTGWTSPYSLTTPAMALVAGTGVKFTADNVSAASTTLSSVYGCTIYDDSISPKAVICAVYFGGTAYNTSNGTFGISWNVSGIFVIDLTP